MPCRAIRGLHVLVVLALTPSSMAGMEAKANTWHKVTAAGAPTARYEHTAVLDSQQRMWIFGGFSSGYLNDLHYFSIEANTWHKVTAAGAPTARNKHTAVLDSQQRMWIFGGWSSGDLLNDLHYFSIEANTWHKVTAAGAPTERRRHTAVLDSQQRMWIFGGYDYDSGDLLNDLHYFSIEANTWHKVTAAGAPTARNKHTAVLDSQQRMWIFGGYGGGYEKLNDLHYFSIEANTWHKVTAAGAPTARDEHTAVLDSQQRMWIFGGWSSVRHVNDLHYFSIEANTWHKVTAAGAPTARYEHTAVLDSQQRMWIFGGRSSGYEKLNDLHYFSIEVSTSTTSTSLEAPANFIEPAPVVVATTTSSVTATTSASSSSSATQVPTTTVSATTSVTATYTTSTLASLSSTWSSSATQVSASTTSMRLAPTNFIELEPAVDVSPTTPSSPTTQPDQALTSAAGDADLSEDPADLLIPILVPTLTCFLAVLAGLGFFCYRDYRARKTRMPQGAAGAEVTFSNPWHGMSLPALPAAVRPLIFAWDARMTAEWPRGKVLNLTVERHEFEAKGRQYSLERPESRGSLQFSWEDGTVQKVDSIQRNVVVWSTQHPRPAWQHFRWICTPQCPVQGHHDMEVQSDRYRCNSCSRSQAAEKHWCCPAHEVHLCPSCAELPPEAPTLGVAAYFLLRLFPSLARSATALDNPNFYEICPHLAHGNTGLGFNKTCPRDGQPNCSVVDALDDAHSGKVTHFVSWCWAYTLDNVVTAVDRWLQKSEADPADVFLWICFFCNNQYRIMQEATQTGSQHLKKIFESHLGVCIQQNFLMEVILPNSAQEFFRHAVSAGDAGLRELTQAVASLDVRDAKAHQRADEDLIKQLILNDIGFDAVNHAVRSRLVEEFKSLFGELFLPR